MTNTKHKIKEVTHQDIVAAFQEIIADSPTLLKRTVRLPYPVKSMQPKVIREIRTSLGFTQDQFAVYLNVPTITARYWETGKREPSGAALRLLAVARTSPEALFAV